MSALPPSGHRAAIGAAQIRRNEIYLAGFSVPDSCTAIRRPCSPLIVPGGLTVTGHVLGDALTVLHTVLYDWST